MLGISGKKQVLGIFVLYISLVCLNASLHSVLRHYQEISPKDITLRAKRDALTRLKSKLVSFKALGRTFSLKLTLDSNALAKDLSAHTIDGSGKVKEVQLSYTGIYNGHDTNHPDHQVDAVEHNGKWHIHVWTPEELYIVEPADRFDPKRRDSNLIVYKSTSVIKNSTDDRTPFCSDFPVDNGHHASQPPQVSDHKEEWLSAVTKTDKDTLKYLPERTDPSNGQLTEINGAPKEKPRPWRNRRDTKKRDSGQANTCDVITIVDYEFYKGIGRHSADGIAKWLRQVYKAVDKTFRKFGPKIGQTTFGIRMKSLVIFTDYTEGIKNHFNMRQNNMSDTETLKSLFRYPEFSKFCLAHLITQRILRGKLGMATLGTAQLDDVKGICPAHNDGHAPQNVGFTTPLDKAGTPMPTSTYIRVLAHEFGHNFGASHDEEGYVGDDKHDSRFKDIPHDACAPKSAEGGKFLMWPYTGFHEDSNSRKFSPCSRQNVSVVLKAKAATCFTPEETPLMGGMCGDGVVGPGEDCDPGSNLDSNNVDKCCTTNCRFSGTAVCSSHNHPCCKDCQTAPDTKRCFTAINNDCTRPSFCDGTDAFSCPRTMPLTDGSRCHDNGTCLQGRCTSLCERMGRDSNPQRDLTPCSCDSDAAAMCKVCCRDVKEHTCVQMGPQIQDGRPCLNGFCLNGECSSKDMNDDLNIGRKLGEDIGDDAEEGTDEEFNKSGAVLVTAGICIAIICITMVITIGMAITIRKSEVQESTDSEQIDELRRILQATIGHLNISPDDENDPTAVAIRDQLLDSEKRKNSTIKESKRYNSTNKGGTSGAKRSG